MSLSERSFDGNVCTCVAACLEREERTHDRCCGTFGDGCSCEACGALAAEQYADGQYQGVDFGGDA